jgi:hypothetical protein
VGGSRTISLAPGAPRDADAALRLALETFTADTARRHGGLRADGWRRAALAEGVERTPAGGAPVYASPRRSRGATRA